MTSQKPISPRFPKNVLEFPILLHNRDSYFQSSNKHLRTNCGEIPSFYTLLISARSVEDYNLLLWKVVVLKTS